MKTLQKIADKYGLQIVPITYKFQGIQLKRKGFDLISKKDRIIYLSFEPRNQTDGTKWAIINHVNIQIHYVKSLLSVDDLLGKSNFSTSQKSTGNILAD
jgi:hypothetical protein